MTAKIDDLSIQSQKYDILTDIGSWLYICGNGTVEMERARTLETRHGPAKCEKALWCHDSVIRPYGGNNSRETRQIQWYYFRCVQLSR